MPRSRARSRVRRRGAGCLAATAAVALLAVGCTVEPPTPVADEPVVAAVVSEAQELKILDRVSGVVAEADRADEARSLASRLSGPALAMRQAELKVAAAEVDGTRLTDLSLEMQQVVLPSEQGWPRSSYGIGVQPKGKGTPVLAAFEQASAREQYKLWGYVQLLPNTTMPRFADPALGSPAVAADDTTLKATPEAAVAQYASVLTVGERSQYAGAFTDDDELRRLLRSYGKLQVDAIEAKDGKGAFKIAYEPTKDPVKAVRTVDGGALVLGAMISQETVRAEERWKLAPLTPSARALWADTEQTNVVRVVYRDMVALYVPPADSDAPVSLVGHHRVPYAVAND
ncbi:hypothetical protein [Promicromonospora iranensis]|uniref:hypothetical protein n=1 Tax=Promicromonospora iranensis TaxID=1105144 RepID=UPI0023A9BBA2|nr:hypothetical protein [Promicromonospora iranensis]